MSNFKFKKRYGQNFLTNSNIIEKIVTSIDPKEEDLIIEIGPGSGAITSKLKKYNSTLIAFEIDEDTKPFLNKLEDDKTSIIYEDFLNVDLSEFLKNYNYRELYIIGNLPYYITTPIIEHIIDSKVELNSLTIMVQKEVADRFMAKPGNREYGYMSVLLRYNFEIEKVVDVPRKFFTPMPKVDSTVLKLNTRNKEPIDYDKFKSVLKSSFQFKRKNLNNNLGSFDKTTVEEILKKHGYTLRDRAEDLDLSTFIDLTNNL